MLSVCDLNQYVWPFWRCLILGWWDLWVLFILLVLSKEWMGIGEWGDYYYSRWTKYSNPAARTMLNPRTPKSQCLGARATKSDVRGLIFFRPLGANALQVTLTLNLGGEGVVPDRRALNISSIYAGDYGSFPHSLQSGTIKVWKHPIFGTCLKIPMFFGARRTSRRGWPASWRQV